MASSVTFGFPNGRIVNKWDLSARLSTNQDLISILPERLFAVRKQTGLSQESFAQRIGVSPRAYKNYELGLREVPLSVISGIHNEFSIELNWLILGKGISNAVNSEDAIQQIIFGIISFEDQFNIKLSKEKMAAVFKYLFFKITNGHDFSEAEMKEYLKSTI